MPVKRKTPSPSPPRTPLAEWIAAGLGLALTLGILGYSLWEATVDRGGPPDLVVQAGRPERVRDGFVVPLTVANRSYATAAGVAVKVRLTQAGAAAEEREATFTYVPGGGEAHGGVLFRLDPSRGRVTAEVQGFEDP